MVAITEKPSYKLADIIFSKKESFTLNDIIKELRAVGVNENKQVIKRALDWFRDNGIIIEHGSFYSLYIKNF